MKSLSVGCFLILFAGLHTYTIDGRVRLETAKIDVDQECVALTENGECEFYDCFFERYNCHDFLLADAKTICMKLNDRIGRLTEPAKKWVHDTQVCSQRVLVQNYSSNSPLDCSAFRQYGFKIHKKCAIDNGVCNIFWDNKFTLTGVLDAHNFSHIRHTLSVLWECSQSQFATWLERLVRLRRYFTGGK